MGAALLLLFGFLWRQLNTMHNISSFVQRLSWIFCNIFWRVHLWAMEVYWQPFGTGVGWHGGGRGRHMNKKAQLTRVACHWSARVFTPSQLLGLHWTRGRGAQGLMKCDGWPSCNVAWVLAGLQTTASVSSEELWGFIWGSLPAFAWPWRQYGSAATGHLLHWVEVWVQTGCQNCC